MGKRAEVDVVINKEGALKDLGEVDRELAKLGKKGDGLWSRLYGDLSKETRKALDGATEEIGKSAKRSLLSLVSGPASAIVAPAKTSFEGAIASAKSYRSEVQRIATATGSDFGQVSQKVNAIALRTGELPGSVINFGRSVRNLTDDWDSASDTLVAYKDRALQLDRPMESLVGTAGNLTNAFGLKGQGQVDKFFGTLDAYAKQSGTSAARLQRQWEGFGEAFGRISSAGPERFAGLTAAFAASSKNPEQAQRNQAFGMGLLNSGVRQIEQRMRKAGKLGRGEQLTDETGEVSDQAKYARAMQFLQEDMVRYYGSKKRAIEVQAGDDLEARRSVGGFLGTDFSGVSGSIPTAQPRTALKSFRMTGTGGRERGEAQKNLRDIGLGLGPLLDAQDAAVEQGGGARGVAMNTAGEVAGTAFSSLGNIALGGLGGLLMGGAGRSLVGRVAGGLGLTNPIMRAGLTGVGIGTAMDSVPLNDRQVTADSKGETLSDLLSRKAFELFNPDAVTTPMQAPGAPGMQAPQAGEPGTAGPMEVALQQGDLRGLSDGFAQALRNQVLRVVPVGADGAPMGQENV